MKVKLNLKERIALITVLPKEGSFKVVARTEELKKKLLFTEEEDKKHGIIYTNDGRVLFNPSQFQGKENARQLTQDYVLKTRKEFDIGETVEDEIESILKKLDNDKKLPADYISLYEMFVDKK